jgi:ABC-2 type transport system permease protein
MIATLKAEFRKLLTLRSTYIFVGIAFILLLIFAFYIEGIQAGGSSLSGSDPHKLDLIMRNAISNTAIFSGIIAILLMTHEYRYNTIIYTLTASRSRVRVLLAKALASSAVAVGFALLVGGLAAGLTWAGVVLGNDHLGPQTIHWGSLLWQGTFYVWGVTMLGLLFAALIRNQIGTIVSFLFVPGTVELLLGMLLKAKAAYLPFTLLSTVLLPHAAAAHAVDTVSPGKAALIFLIYLVVGWTIGAFLFKRRDAN